jgi:hypothetical protein
MNIKEHIEAGHYPKDENGHYIVPLRNGGLAWIYSTAHGRLNDRWPIAGSVCNEDCVNGSELRCWAADGSLLLSGSITESDLMPPGPRKVKVKRWGGFYRSEPGTLSGFIFESQIEALGIFGEGMVVEFTGEYEEKWGE